MSRTVGRCFISRKLRTGILIGSSCHMTRVSRLSHALSHDDLSHDLCVYVVTWLVCTCCHMTCHMISGHSTGFKYKDGVMTKLTGAAEPLFYNQQHSWGLFSSLALSMAQRLAQNRPGPHSVCLYVYMYVVS